MRLISRAPTVMFAPGLALTVAIAAAAFAAHQVPGLGLFNPMVLALAVGILWRSVFGVPQRFTAGIGIAQRTILRAGIALLGLQITAADVVGVGLEGLAIIIVALGATFIATVWFGRIMKVDAKLAELLAAGTSICGASAIVATNSVTRARDEDVAYAVACITLCGSVAIFAFPAVSALAQMTDRSYGLWAGTSIHEIAQVVAAAYQGGPAAGAFATIVKLTRVLMLGPVVLILAFLAARRAIDAPGQTPTVRVFPRFIVGFIALATLSSLTAIPTAAMDGARFVTTFLLSVALAAFGLAVDFGLIRSTGVRPFLLCVVASLFIAGLSFALIALMD